MAPLPTAMRVIPRNVPNVAIEAASKDYWYKYVGRDGLIIGLDSFGRSAPAPAVYQDLGLAVPDIVTKINTWFKANCVVEQKIWL
jgi:transketolase